MRVLWGGYGKAHEKTRRPVECPNMNTKHVQNLNAAQPLKRLQGETAASRPFDRAGPDGSGRGGRV